MAARVERLALCGLHRRFIALVSLGSWFDIYDIFMMAYLGAALQHSRFLTLPQFSQLIAAGFLGMFIGTVIFGMGSDYFGRRTSFVLMLAIYSVFTLLGAFAPNAATVIILRVLAGIGIGAELVVIDAYVTEMVPMRARGRYVAITQFVGFTAIPVVAFLARLLVPTQWLLEGWRWVMVIGGTGALFVWYLQRRLPESSRWCESRGRQEQPEAIMLAIEKQVERETQRPLPAPEMLDVRAARQVPLRELWQPAYRGRTAMLMVFHQLQTIGIYGFANWAPTFFLKQGRTLGQSLEYDFLIALVSPLGPLLGVWTAERLERKRAIVVLSLLMAVTGLGFPFASGAIAIVAIGALLTVFSYWFSAVFHAYQAELFPTRARATGVGFTYSWSRLSAVFSSLIIGALLARGVLAVFLLVASAMMGVALVVGVFGPRTNAAHERCARTSLYWKRFPVRLPDPNTASPGEHMPLNIEIKRIEPDVVVFELAGRIAVGRESQQIEWQVEELLRQDQKKFVFDLAGIDYIDSTGVGIIAFSAGKIKQAGGELRVAGARGMVQDVLKLVNLQAVVGSYPTAAAAAEGF